MAGIFSSYVSKEVRKLFFPYEVGIAFSLVLNATGKLPFPCEVVISFFPIPFVVPPCYVLPFMNDSVQDWGPFDEKALRPF